jgi:hypothetical protein
MNSMSSEVLILSEIHLAGIRHRIPHLRLPCIWALPAFSDHRHYGMTLPAIDDDHLDNPGRVAGTCSNDRTSCHDTGLAAWRQCDASTDMSPCPFGALMRGAADKDDQKIDHPHPLLPYQNECKERCWGKDAENGQIGSGGDHVENDR